MRWVMMASLSVMLTACGEETRPAAAVGLWKFDLAETELGLKADLERVAPGSPREELRAQTLEFLQRQLGEFHIELQLSADGTVVQRGTREKQELHFSGTWQSDPGTGDIVVSGGGGRERYRLKGDRLVRLVPVRETRSSDPRNLELVLVRAD